MTFEEAIGELKQGKGIYRKVWPKDEFAGFWTYDYNDSIMKYYWDGFRGRIHQTEMKFSGEDILANDWEATETYRYPYYTRFGYTRY
jgi:hypothetical protein